MGKGAHPDLPQTHGQAVLQETHLVERQKGRLVQISYIDNLSVMASSSQEPSDTRTCWKVGSPTQVCGLWWWSFETGNGGT